MASQPSVASGLVRCLRFAAHPRACGVICEASTSSASTSGLQGPPGFLDLASSHAKRFYSGGLIGKGFVPTRQPQAARAAADHAPSSLATTTRACGSATLRCWQHQISEAPSLLAIGMKPSGRTGMLSASHLGRGAAAQQLPSRAGTNAVGVRLMASASSASTAPSALARVRELLGLASVAPCARPRPCMQVGAVHAAFVCSMRLAACAAWAPQ